MKLFCDCLQLYISDISFVSFKTIFDYSLKKIYKNFAMGRLFKGKFQPHLELAAAALLTHCGNIV